MWSGLEWSAGSGGGIGDDEGEVSRGRRLSLSTRVTLLVKLPTCFLPLFLLALLAPLAPSALPPRTRTSRHYALLEVFLADQGQVKWQRQSETAYLRSVPF